MFMYVKVNYVQKYFYHYKNYDKYQSREDIFFQRLSKYFSWYQWLNLASKVGFLSNFTYTHVL